MSSVKYTKSKFNPDNIKSGRVRIGWFSGTRYDDGIPVAQVARWQEYGTPDAKYPIKARPFMRPVLHGQGNQLRAKLKTEYAKAIRNNENTQKVLLRFGEYVTSQIRQSIRMTVTPANRPVTLEGGWLKSSGGIPFYVEPKRGNHPLIDTGFMLDSIDYQVQEVSRG